MDDATSRTNTQAAAAPQRTEFAGDGVVVDESNKVYIAVVAPDGTVEMVEVSADETPIERPRIPSAQECRSACQYHDAAAAEMRGAAQSAQAGVEGGVGYASGADAQGRAQNGRSE